jgi:serine/threonine-protein kinase RsbW
MLAPASRFRDDCEKLGRPMLQRIRTFFASLFNRSGASTEPEIWNFVLRGERREIGAINEALERAAGAGGVPEPAIRKLQIALDELLTNALSYAKVSPQTPAKVDIVIDQRAVRALLRYQGVNFNPFSDTAAPDLNADVADRPIGGLGVHLVKELMDECTHQFEDDHNILVIGKRFR